MSGSTRFPDGSNSVISSAGLACESVGDQM